MEILDELLNSIDITESELMDLQQYYKNTNFYGKFPTDYKNEIYTEEQSCEYDFTNSFIDFMTYNKDLLNFGFQKVDSPSYSIIYTDMKTKIKGTKREIVSMILNNETGIVRSYKTQISISTILFNDIIKNNNIYALENFYNQILTQMNSMMNIHVRKSVYIYKLFAIRFYDYYTLMLRYGISHEGIDNIMPIKKLIIANNNSLVNKSWKKMS